jgi:mono/diheme cytochrome c family protein
MTFGCWQCHGEAGQGAVATGPHIAKTALPYESFANQLRHPAAEMPPYEAAVVTDAQVADLYAYVQSLPGPVDPKTTPLLANMGVK